MYVVSDKVQVRLAVDPSYRWRGDTTLSFKDNMYSVAM